MTHLVLFDVDGTLLLTHDDIYVEANRAALQEVFGVAPEGPDVPGDTALAHTRRALRSAGFSDDDIDAKRESWCDVFSRRYVDLLAHSDTSSWRVGPDAATTLPRIESRALLTGNPEAVARARMQRIGLGDVFPPGQGAFGCEREDRVALFALARERAGDWPAAQTVAVGDTPLDVSTAHAAGARCIGITTGRYDRTALRNADAVIDALRELPAALERL